MSSLDVSVQTSAADFRHAMRRLTGGVSVITVGKESDISGMTVTSVSSLSVEPATVIVSVNRKSSSWSLLRQYGVFGVNVLSSEQIDVAERFSGRDGAKGAARYNGARWITRVTGVPLLVGALTTMDCEVEEILERHSHGIVIGRVRDVRILEHRGALAYWQGEYVAIDHDHDAAKLAEISLPVRQAHAEGDSQFGFLNGARL